MTSTELRAPEPEIEVFFQRQVLPLSRSLGAAGRSFFLLRPDPGRQTYFSSRAKTVPEPGDLELPRCTSPAELEARLRELWASQDAPELVSLAPALGELAELLSLREEPEAEVSPFIYVMF